MKVGEKVVLMLDDGDGFAAAISGGLHPNPNSKFNVEKGWFELSLEQYGLVNRNAIGEMIHFVGPDGGYEVSIVILHKNEPPILACALNELLSELSRNALSKMPSLIIPFILPEYKLKQENKIESEMVSVYGIKFGPTTDLTEALSSRLQKAPPYMQIYHEGLAELLHLANIVKLPTVVLVGVINQHRSNKTAREEIEVTCEIGDLLASTLSVSFSKEKTSQSVTKSSSDNKEAWRALYG
ncbi:uncharacterized protein LOC127247131 [Andrographis paniculata]|uniref:uncharacterized protein LOC127247131 n=1 Tax=Andrographis paniculata TaxID=175694 RepID=UPI0021E97C85|nr:uncharacterized protein LOC127247131 [Andrographis paniculata]